MTKTDLSVVLKEIYESNIFGDIRLLELFASIPSVRKYAK